MKHSEIIREVVKLLKLKASEKPIYYRSPYLCDCIQLVFGDEIGSYAKREIKFEIRKQIGNHFDLSAWLVAEHNVPRSKLTNKNGNFTKAMQNYRVRYAEHLAEQYEAKGM